MLRRDFLKSAGQLAASAAWLPCPIAPAAAAAGTAAENGSLFRWERVKPDAWVVFNGGGNTLVIADRGGAIIVDCKINGMGQLLRAEIESRVGPIAAIVMTHHHGDHSGGYPAFPGTRAIAHTSALPRIRARAERLAAEARSTPDALTDALLTSLATDFEVPRGPAAERAIAADVRRLRGTDPATAVPTEQVGDRLELRIGHTTLELMHAGPGHTDNDLVVHDRTRGLLHAGDLLFYRHHPFIDVASGGVIHGWLAALADVRRGCNEETVVIAGHGPIGSRAALDEQATYFERLRNLVSRARAAGRSREEILKLPNTLAPAYGFATEWSSNLGIALDEIEKHKPA